MPCCFIYIYNALLLSNPAWNSFLGTPWLLFFYSATAIDILIDTHTHFNIDIDAYYAVVGLDFSNFDLGLLTLAGAILSYFALVLYKKYLFETSWRKVNKFAPQSKFNSISNFDSKLNFCNILSPLLQSLYNKFNNCREYGLLRRCICLQLSFPFSSASSSSF